MEKPITICLAADKNYLRHLMVTMASVLLHADSIEQFRFIILSDGSLEGAQIDTLKSIRDFEFEVINVSELVLKYLTVSKDQTWPLSAYYRLLLPFVCPDLTKVLYLDCDIVVRTSLQELWNTPMGGKTIAAVIDTGNPLTGESHLERLSRQGGCIEGDYFNSGVLLWQLSNIDLETYKSLLFSAYKQMPAPDFADQCWLNLMFDREKKVLMPKWNATNHIFLNEPQYGPYTDAELDDARQHPCICHYTNIKPWKMTFNEHPYWFEYWEILKQTPFAWRFPFGILKKILFSRNDTFLFRYMRPTVKRMLRIRS